MMEITNIVPVVPVETEQGLSESTESVNGELLSPTEYSQKLAADAIQFLEEEFKENVSKEFWEVIRDSADARLGSPNKPISINPMTAEQAKSFGMELVLWGKYTGQRVMTVMKKDKVALETLATKPHPFQVNLLKYLLCPIALPKAPKKGK